MSPQFPPQFPADLARAPLLLPDYPPWSLWLDAAGVPLTQPLKGLRVDDASLALKAACTGLGAVVIRQDLVEADLAAGRLVRLFDITAITGLGCYFVWRESNPQIEAIRRCWRGSRRRLGFRGGSCRLKANPPLTQAIIARALEIASDDQ